MEGLEQWGYELSQRIKWWTSGVDIHCIPLDLVWGISTERLCELYNVDISFFKLNKQ